MSELAISQEFKNLIPPLQADEYAALKESISKEGCRDAIVVWDGVIVDGHNRFEICGELGLQYNVLEMSFNTGDEAKLWILKNQMARRNITDYTKSQLALKCKDIIAAKAKENLIKSGELYGKGSQISVDPIEQIEFGVKVCQNSDKPIKSDELYGKGSQISAKPIEQIDTQKELAKLAGVSHDTIHKVETIESQAPEPIRDAAANNVISINRAYDVTRKLDELPPEEQSENIKRFAKTYYETPQDELKKAMREETKHFITDEYGKKHPITQQQYDEMNRETQEEFKKIDEMYDIARNISDGVTNALLMSVSDENFRIFLDIEMEARTIDSLLVDIDTAINKLEMLKGYIAKTRQVRRVK